MGATVKRASIPAVLIAICLAVTCFITGGATALAAERPLTTSASALDATTQVDSSGEHWVTVKSGLVKTVPLNIKWNWNDLLQDATKADENLNLAVAGIVMSEQAEVSKARVEAVLKDIGFADLYSSHYLVSTDIKNDVNQPARTFGHKTITKDGKEYHIVCAVFKGTTTVDDAVTDIESIVDGFLTAGQNCAKSLASYVGTIKGATKDNTVLFITGHSLGASTANVVGRLSGDLANDSAKFVYSIASPNYRTDDDEKNVKNFRTFTNEDDIVPYVPINTSHNPVGKIGVERFYKYSDLAKEQKGRFNRVYLYLTGKLFEDDNNPTGIGKGSDSKAIEKLKNHLCQTYMSFILSENLDDDQLDFYLGKSRVNPIAVATKNQSVVLGSAAKKIASANVFTVKNAKGAVTYAKTSGVAGITVSKAGAVTVKKSVKAGTYTIGVEVKAAGDEFYNPRTVDKTFKVKVKKANPMVVKGKTATVTAGKKTVLSRSKVLSVSKARGKVTYVKKSKNKYVTINKSTGKVTVKKGLKKGTYKVKVAVRAAGNSAYAAKTVTKVFKIKVKAAIAK